MAYQVALDTRANWIAANRVPLSGEECFETDTGQRKFGDGSTAYTSLPYVNIPIPTPAPSDGQLLAYSASLNKYVAVNPTGLSELAYAENVSGAGSPVSSPGSGAGSLVDILGCNISVPVSSRPVWLEFGGFFYQSDVGAGSVYLSVIETTSGSSNLYSAVYPIPQKTGGLDASQVAMSVLGTLRLGATVASRQFKLQALVYSFAGVLVGGQFVNSPTGPSFISATAR